MTGMNRHTGQEIDGDDDLAQSVGDILTTMIGSRVARRDYGGLWLRLIDQPMNTVLRLRLFASTALAISRWEPRLKVTSFGLSASPDGTAHITITGQRRDRPASNSLTRLTIPLP